MVDVDVECAQKIKIYEVCSGRFGSKGQDNRFDE